MPSSFHDNYLDIDFDLSRVLFIATANTTQTISQPLLDRMELIDVSGYITEDKIEIAHRHLVPRQRDNHGIKKDQITIPKVTLKQIIESYTRESGVRDLERKIAKIMPDDLVFYISHYGYLAIFLCIFLQEVGAPTPLPNELILLFTGYLAFTGVLHTALVIVTVVCGDLLAATILYTVFHFFGNYLLSSKSRWIPISQQSIRHQSQKIARHGRR